MGYRKLSDAEIEKQYALVENYHKTYLEMHGVKLPKLHQKGHYTLDGLVLVYLSLGYPDTKAVTKEELTQFIREYYPNTNDVQQARHLGAQKGFFIASSRRNDKEQLPPGTYKLISLEKIYPNFTSKRRQATLNDWDALKKSYGNRCATCGSKEGSASFMWPNVITQLQKAHMNPNKELSDDNVIPQCQECNRADRNNWVYDKKGRVIQIANALVIQNCDEDVQYEIYKLLYAKFEGKQP